MFMHTISTFMLTISLNGNPITYNNYIYIYIYPDSGSKGGAVVRARASHQRGPDSIPGVDAICGLSLLLILSLAPRGFSPGTPVSPSP